MSRDPNATGRFSTWGWGVDDETERMQPGQPGAAVQEPIARRANGAAEIATHLRQAILQGVYAHGERLPAERQLAAHFGASRGTARQALRELEKTNLVTRRIGSGTFVNYSGLSSADDVAETTSPLELIEVRFAMEPHMVRLAVINATGRDLRSMRQALEQVEAADNPEDFTDADAAFHLALAECSQNPLIVWLYRHINAVRGHSQWSAMKGKILTPTRIAEYNEQHRRLYQALMSRDSNGATQIMTSHLVMARNDFLGAQETPLGADRNVQRADDSR